MGRMRVMGRNTGDDTLLWSADDEKAIDRAKKLFDEAVAEGATAYKIVEVTSKKRGEEIKQFDPSLEEIYIAPRMVGG